MNNLKCPNCNVVNWAKNKACVRCKSPLNNGLTPMPTRNFPTGNDRTKSKGGRYSTNKILVGGISLFCLLFLFHQIIKPKKVNESAKSEEGKKHLEAPAVTQPSSHVTPKTPEELGVRIIDLKKVATDAAKTLGEGDTHTFQDGYETTTTAWGGTPGTPSAWRNTATSPRMKTIKLCDRTVYGQHATVQYYKTDSEVVALTITNVDQQCGDNPRTGALVEAQYVWRNTGNNIFAWEYAPNITGITKVQEYRYKLEEEAKLKSEKDKENAKKSREQKRKLEQELERFRQ